MSLIEYARSELQAAGLFDKNSDYGGMLGNAVMKMIEQFDDEGHSGASAGMAISIFSRLARFEPLSPLTGADDEWNEVGSDTWQNRRCPHVFKGKDGIAYDSTAVVFEDPDGCRYTSRDSRRTIEFPYTPKTEIVKVSCAH